MSDNPARGQNRQALLLVLDHGIFWSNAGRNRLISPASPEDPRPEKENITHTIRVAAQSLESVTLIESVTLKNLCDVFTIRRIHWHFVYSSRLQ